MIRILLWVLPCLLFACQGFGQKYFTREGKISFYSEAPVENIEAHNNSATSVIDFDTGNLEFAVLIKAFQFEKALMQEHFNENYMESNKFPKSNFKGRIQDYDRASIMAEGEHQVTVSGEMTIHGVTRKIEVEGNITVQGGQISASSAFEQEVADYEIKVPRIVRDNIAKTVSIKVDLQYEEFKSN